jgi:hypothetical protein
MQDNSETTLGGGYRDDFGGRVKKTRDIDCYRCSPGIGKGAFSRGHWWWSGQSRLGERLHEHGKRLGTAQ